MMYWGWGMGLVGMLLMIVFWALVVAGATLGAVAGERVKLMVQNRAILGSAESRRLRRQGLIPGVLYGAGAESVRVQVDDRN